MFGIYGGTFNPIHYGHLRTALEVKEHFSIQEMRLLPCFLPAHRENPDVSAQMRLQMLDLALEKYPQLQVDAREIARSGVSYMVDTLASFRNDGIKQPIILFIGVDAFNGLTRWHRWQDLFLYAHIVVMTRPQFIPIALHDFYKDKLVTDRDSLKSCVSGKIYFQQVRQLDISATDIRLAFMEQKDPSFLLPEIIIEYIRDHQLYGT